MHIAVADRSVQAWTAGRTFTEVVVRALRAAGGAEVRVTVLGDRDAHTWGEIAAFKALPRLHPGEDRALHAAHLPSRSELFCATHSVDALLLADYRPGAAPYTRISWIPDFQHRQLPAQFTLREGRSRDGAYRRCAKISDYVLLSSKSAFADFRTYLPRFAHKGKVLSFPSLYCFTPPQADPGFARQLYQLPAKYALVANQFWSHKNHMVVVQAASLLQQRGLSIPIAMTGLPADYRDPQNGAVSALLQAIAQHGLAGQVIVLGMVPRVHLTDLMRCAALIIQPSRFEGWNTSLQDALTLGRPALCSAIPVHKEQDPDALGFFPCDDPGELATLLERVWTSLAPGPNLEHERRSIERQHAMAIEYGRSLIKLCKKAAN